MLLLALIAALYGLLFIALNSLARWQADNGRLLGRLSHRRRVAVTKAPAESKLARRYGAWLRKLGIVLETMEWRIRPGTFVQLSIMLLLAGLAGGVLLFQSVKGSLMLGIMAGAAPYVCLRMLLLNRQMQVRMDFLPAVELFYQCYLISGARHIRPALKRTIEEKRLLGPIQAIFEQLYRNLSVKGNDEESLAIFSASMGHVWGDYFVNLLQASLVDGYPIASNLKELVTDMRRARRTNQQERNRLLEIRLANFSPPLFLVLFIGINMRYNPENSYYYYVIDPQGRDMLLNAFALMFGSFAMGLYLSRKQM